MHVHIKLKNVEDSMENIKYFTQEWLGKYNTRKYRPCDCQNLVFFPCYNSHRLKLYSFMLEHMTDEQRFQITAKICTEVKWPPTKQWQQTHQNINYNPVLYIQYSPWVSQNLRKSTVSHHDGSCTCNSVATVSLCGYSYLKH